jgi:protein-S-isoprenylcysteine O-methyltransferase Ste14
MTVLCWICLGAFLWNMALFAQAICHAFTRPEGMPLLMRVLSGVGLAGVFADSVLLASIREMHPWQAVAGAIFLALSQWLFRAALSAMRTAPLSLAFSNDVPAFLLQRGPYRRVRHPFYTAYALSWLAVVVLTWSGVALMVFLIISALYVTAALREERKFLRSTLAADYRAYQQRTGMFLPFVSHTSPNTP